MPSLPHHGFAQQGLPAQQFGKLPNNWLTCDWRVKSHAETH